MWVVIVQFYFTDPWISAAERGGAGMFCLIFRTVPIVKISLRSRRERANCADCTGGDEDLGVES